jgi:UDP-3-O-[3-hydroxymyristoyl] N-acetylglucosamine deacetylase
MAISLLNTQLERWNFPMQATLKTPVGISGIGLHSGRPVSMHLYPAAPGRGIVFQRSDLSGEIGTIPARHDAVHDARLCTVVSNDAGASVSTIEHLMAALSSCGIQNVLIEIDGPEVPIMDGSALPFLQAILSVGIAVQDQALNGLVVQEAFEVRIGESWARLEPSDRLQISCLIDFDDEAIGRQCFDFEPGKADFAEEIAGARTFCRLSDVEAMRASGRARGGSYDNAVVVNGADILTPGGLRLEREFVRHKVLDVVGDIALFGRPIIGRIVAERPGHALTNKLMRELASRIKDASSPEALAA